MKILKALVLVMFAMGITPYSQAGNAPGFMLDWPNPDPCDGECSSYIVNSLKTIDSLTARAESGDANAQLLLAQMYQNGKGVAKDDAAAIQWYSKAADLGSVEAKYKLAQRYKNGIGINGDDKDTKRAFAYAHNAAELGHPMAQFVVGKMYLDGVGVDSNIASGMQWLTTAAGQGNPMAQYMLGDIAMKGSYGQARDWQKAVAWFRQSSETQPDPRVDRWSIAFIYHEGGYGVLPDAEESMAWFAATGKSGEEAEAVVSLFNTLIKS